ncbi:aminoglycoside phosphotransferase family protein [Alkalihalobacillus trypoxylicola]|uniref:Aminoglycoside phosphotransferase n=1 Tax=Alkalihalobacillus trypoxylicola TaxID=519424 RepID=A0A161PG83_9BACI|nr:aminoglycoside phosphotransferase family protein [Alkalihalobacillus trypoxylicola]KYG31774.1 aminoglycoside phosphotransferase [Alkalihalobacillus trypoxylicola]
MKHQFENEKRLAGGNISNVYRKGNTVRRELKPESTHIHKLLKHLESKNYDYAPTFLGIDENGREILSYIEGEAGSGSIKNYMWSNDALEIIAKMLRGYHDAVNDFPIDESWQPIDNTPLPFEVICHNDFAIYNIIFAHKTPVGIIDFDVAGPGPKLWDIAYTLYTCVPLSRLYYTEKGEAVYYHSKDASTKKERIHLFFQSYGLKRVDIRLIEMVLLRLKGLCNTIKRKARNGDIAFQKMIEEGHLQHYEQDITFISQEGENWV